MAVDKKAVAAGARRAPGIGTFNAIAKFVREVVAELRKVAWPSRDEVLKLTIVVLIAIGAFAIYIFVLDTSFGQVAQRVFHLGGSSTGAR
jgi:preprotein translocase subunit SecE